MSFTYKYKIKDIRYNIGRIIVSGSNNYNDPWRILNIPPELKTHFNFDNLKEFIKVL